MMEYFIFGHSRRSWSVVCGNVMDALFFSSFFKFRKAMCMSIYRRSGGKRPAAFVHTTGVEASKQAIKNHGRRRGGWCIGETSTWCGLALGQQIAHTSQLVVVGWILCNIGSEGVVAFFTSMGLLLVGYYACLYEDSNAVLRDVSSSVTVLRYHQMRSRANGFGERFTVCAGQRPGKVKKHLCRCVFSQVRKYHPDAVLDSTAARVDRRTPCQS